MALGTLNGVPILEARVQMPSSGAWTADVVLPTDGGPGDMASATLDFGALQLVGTAVRGGSYLGASMVRLVGGGAGLGTQMAPKEYRGVPLSIPLKEILAAAGDTLSAASEADALSYNLPRWLRFAQSAGEAIAALAVETGRAWRVLADGTVWVGTESYPSAAPAYQLVRGDPHLGSVEVAMDAPLLIPGIGFLGFPVVAVEHVVTEDRVRSVVTFQ